MDESKLPIDCLDHKGLEDAVSCSMVAMHYLIRYGLRLKQALIVDARQNRGPPRQCRFLVPGTLGRFGTVPGGGPRHTAAKTRHMWCRIFLKA